MKIIQVYTPMQSLETENPQLIDGEIKTWCVKTEAVREGWTFIQWLKEKELLIDNDLFIPNINAEGIYLYDVIPCVIPYYSDAPYNTYVNSKGVLMVRFDYITKNA